jgi:hypothetical protein
MSKYWAIFQTQLLNNLAYVGNLLTGSIAIIILAQYGLQGSITQIGVVTSGVPTSIQRQILATHKEPSSLCLSLPSFGASPMALLAAASSLVCRSMMSFGI